MSTRNTSWSGDRRSFPSSARAAILRRDPICVACGERPSTIADHEPSYVELVRAGVTNPQAVEYGQGLCERCHDAKTAVEQRAGRNRWRLTPESHPGLL